VKRSLPYELFLGLRYLGSRGKRAHLSLFVWIGVGGVFLGVSALIVVLAVMTGFQDGIRDRIISANPHLLVFQTGGAGMLDAGRVAGQVRQVPGVRAATPFVLQQALFTSPGGDAHGGLVRGVDLSDGAVAGDLRSHLRTGRLDSFAEGGDGILLGVELARVLGVLPGDAVTVISPKGALTAVGMVPKMRRFTVAGTIQVGMHEYDSSIAYLPLGPAREFAGLPGVTGVEVKLSDPFDAKGVGRTLANRLGVGYWIRDWMEMNRNLFAALQLEKLALFVIVTIIVLVAAFFTVGMTIGVVGTLAGSVVGLAIIWVQNTYKVIRLAGDVYQIDHLPMKLTPTDFLMIVGATLLLSFFATIVPARRAGALQPVDVLRYE
jgi:lipoprotein-releasing system permease protein